MLLAVRFLFLSILSLSLLSCSGEGKRNESTVDNSPFSVTSRTILDYSAVSVTVNFQGSFLNGSINDLDEVQFFSDSSCQGSPIASLIMNSFKNSGIDLDLAVNTTTSLYVSTLASSDCFFVEDYLNPTLTPQDPSFLNVSPPSPSRTVFTPGIFGDGFPLTGTVSFYNDDQCLNLIDQGNVSDFRSTGVQITVPQNATTSIYAQITDFSAQASACVLMLDYTHSNTLSDPPVLTSINPVSPSNVSTTPTIIGTTAPGTVSVALYSDSACSAELISGDPADFSSTGFQITTNSNSTVTVYAKSIDDLDQPSVCALFGNYTHDNIPPDDPSYIEAIPVSPTNQTTSPLIRGLSSVDTNLIRFYDSNFCQTGLGVGPKVDFEGSGISVGVASNDTTTIFGKAFDEAGNESSCVSFTSYIHNTIPPSTPLFNATIPTSPTNASLTPLIQGDAAPRTVSLDFYKDENCVSNIGQGSAIDYENAGIQVTVDSNTVTSIYVRVSDQEGNISPCEFHASYDHSSSPSPSPAFFATFPASPSNSSNTPSVIGTADSQIQRVDLYSENTCTNSLGGGTRGQFVSSGVVVNLPANSTNDIYARATDVYGNLSGCSLLTQYIHNTVPPFDPTYASVSPVSPNNISITPTIFGDSLVNPASQLPPLTVSFYDSPSCVSQLGSGSPSDFSSPGIVINVAANGLTQIYGRTIDEAGNFSNCTYLTDYIHNNRIPAVPQFLTSSPGSPSYSPDILISGSYGTSNDFMNRVSIVVADDPSCSNVLTTANPALFNSSGVPVTVGLNQISDLYAYTINEVGTESPCTSLTSFRHYDLAPTSLSSILFSDGSVGINWFPDTVSSPSPRYSVERSLSSTGPFTVIASNLISNSYRDFLVSDNTEYFYRVYASNSTGRSQNSTITDQTVTSPSSIPAASLIANGFDARVSLSWSGFPQNMAYKISRSTNFGGPFERITGDIVATSFDDTDVINNQPYYYLVEATNPSGLSMRSNIASAVPRVTPDAPIDLKLTPLSSNDACGGARGVRASWTPSKYYSNFRVHRGRFKGNTNSISSPTTQVFDQCGLSADDIFYYSIAAQWGTENSVNSNYVGFYASSAPVLNVSPGNGEILLNWNVPTVGTDLNSATIFYNVYKSTDPDGEFSLLAPGITNTLYADTAVNGEGAYYYVQAYLTDGGGDRVYVAYPSNVESGTAGVDPVAPTNLTLNYVESASRVELNWSRPTHYNGFQIYHSTNVGGPYTPVNFVTNNSFLLSAAVNQGMNYFKVTTVWGSIESADSNIVSFREGRVNNLSASPSALDVSLSWSSIPAADDYVVYRATDKNGPYSSIAIQGTNSYIDTTAVSGQGYYYKVKSRFLDATESVDSNIASAMRTDSAAPSGVSLSVQGGSFIVVNWPAVSGATQYEVFLSTSFAGPYSSRGLTATNSFNLLGLINNTEYFVKIAAISGMTSTESSVVSAFTYAKPNTPSGVVGDNQIELAWTALAGVNNYDILRSSDGINFSTLAVAFPSTSYVDLTATNGSIYFYKIQGNFTSGQTVSDSSIGYSPGTTPLAPSNLVAENNDTATEVNLTWSEVSGTTSYNIYSSTISGSYGAAIQSSNTHRGTRVTGLTAGTTYYFVVTAVNGTQESLVSNEVVIIPQLEPSKPIAQFSDATSIDITWLVDPLASTYSLYRSEDGRVFTEIATGLASTNHNDVVPDVNRTYYYRFQGFDASGVELSLSKVSDGTVLNVIPDAPLGLQVFAFNVAEVNLEWAFVPNIQRYEILRGLTQGGPYSFVASPAAGDLSYVDTSVVSGQTYYYVIRSISFSGVPSSDSIEKSIELISGPAGLNVVNGSSTIDASWSSLAGAVSYNLRRSLVSGGPYGIISNTVSLSFSDTDFVANKTYYYVVEGVFADGRVSVLSPEQSLTRSGFLFFQVPVELTDTPISSLSSSSVAFQRTQTSFNTDFYDGVVSYELEVMAANLDSVNRNLNVIDSSDNVIGSLSVPALTNNPTRIRTSFSPVVGDAVYRLELEQTNTDGDLSIRTAKLLVNQENATKTRIYIPLLTNDRAPASADLTETVFSTSDEVYQDFSSSLRYLRDTTKFKEIIDYNGWELEALVSTTGVAEGIFGLENLDTGVIVNTTETRFADNAITLASVPFDEGVANFTLDHENDQYRISMKCEFNCASGTVNLYKAGLWVTLENLASVRIVNRLALQEGAISSDTDRFDERFYYDSSRYTSPKVYFQALLSDDVSSDGSVELVFNNEDSGNNSLTPLLGSEQLVNSDTLLLYTSPMLTMIDLQNYVTRIKVVSGSIDFRGSSVVIDVGN